MRCKRYSSYLVVDEGQISHHNDYFYLCSFQLSSYIFNLHDICHLVGCQSGNNRPLGVIQRPVAACPL